MFFRDIQRECSQDLNWTLHEIAQNIDVGVIIMTLTSLSWHRGKYLTILSSRWTCYSQVGYVEYWGLLHHFNCKLAISKKFRSKYIYKVNSALCAPIAEAAIKQLFLCALDMRVAYRDYQDPPVNNFLAQIWNPIHYCLVF